MKSWERKSAAQMRGDTTGEAEYKGIGLFQQLEIFQIKIIIVFST